MTWFRRKKDEYEVVTSEVPMTTVYRWYLYDTAMNENINELAEAVGLTPISKEGEAKELEDSEARLIEIQQLYPFIDSISDISAKVLTTLHVKEIDNLPDDTKENMLNALDDMFAVYKAVAFSTLIGAFSIGINLNMIQTNALNMDVLYLGEDNE